MFKWEKGRQGTGYFKCKLMSGKSFDVYILKYPKNSYLEEHTDDIDGKEHHRLNIVLQRASIGGVFNINGKSQDKIFNYFRPDIEPHRLTKIHSGTRYVLSIGWQHEYRRYD